MLHPWMGLWMWLLGIWFNGEHSDTELMVGFDDLRGLSNCHDFMIFYYFTDPMRNHYLPLIGCPLVQE